MSDSLFAMLDSLPESDQKSLLIDYYYATRLVAEDFQIKSLYQYELQGAIETEPQEGIETAEGAVSLVLQFKRTEDLRWVVLAQILESDVDHCISIGDGIGKLLAELMLNPEIVLDMFSKKKETK